MKKEFHHIGIPTTKVQPDEIYLAGAKLYITDANKSEHHIEWLRFEPDSSMHELLKRTPHVAFTVDRLERGARGPAGDYPALRAHGGRARGVHPGRRRPGRISRIQGLLCRLTKGML